MNDMENNLLSSINSLKDEILNLKEFVFENLQNENEKRQQKWEQLERPCPNTSLTIMLWANIVIKII